MVSGIIRAVSLAASLALLRRQQAAETVCSSSYMRRAPRPTSKARSTTPCGDHGRGGGAGKRSRLGSWRRPRRPFRPRAASVGSHEPRWRIKQRSVSRMCWLDMARTRLPERGSAHPVEVVGDGSHSQARLLSPEWRAVEKGCSCQIGRWACASAMKSRRTGWRATEALHGFKDHAHKRTSHRSATTTTRRGAHTVRSGVLNPSERTPWTAAGLFRIALRLAQIASATPCDTYTGTLECITLRSSRRNALDERESALVIKDRRQACPRDAPPRKSQRSCRRPCCTARPASRPCSPAAGSWSGCS